MYILFWMVFSLVSLDNALLLSLSQPQSANIKPKFMLIVTFHQIKAIKGLKNILWKIWMYPKRFQF